jgi:hypothetical protein
MTVSGTDRARALIQIEALLSRSLSLEWRGFGPDVAIHLCTAFRSRRSKLVDRSISTSRKCARDFVVED